MQRFKIFFRYQGSLFILYSITIFALNCNMGNRDEGRDIFCDGYILHAPSPTHQFSSDSYAPAYHYILGSPSSHEDFSQYGSFDSSSPQYDSGSSESSSPPSEAPDDSSKSSS